MKYEADDGMRIVNRDGLELNTKLKLGREKEESWEWRVEKEDIQ